MTEAHSKDSTIGGLSPDSMERNSRKDYRQILRSCICRAGVTTCHGRSRYLSRPLQHCYLYLASQLIRPSTRSLTRELCPASSSLHDAGMAVGVDSNRPVAGDTKSESHTCDGDNNGTPAMPPKPAPRHAPKLDIPLRERNHPEAYFAEEREGWHGYIEWERYPEKKTATANILSQYAFDDVGLDNSVFRSRIYIDFRPAPRISIEAFARHEPGPRRCTMEAVSCGNGDHPRKFASRKLGDR